MLLGSKTVLPFRHANEIHRNAQKYSEMWCDSEVRVTWEVRLRREAVPLLAGWVTLCRPLVWMNVAPYRICRERRDRLQPYGHLSSYIILGEVKPTAIKSPYCLFSLESLLLGQKSPLADGKPKHDDKKPFSGWWRHTEGRMKNTWYEHVTLDPKIHILPFWFFFIHGFLFVFIMLFYFNCCIKVEVAFIIGNYVVLLLVYKNKVRNFELKYVKILPIYSVFEKVFKFKNIELSYDQRPL